MLSIRHFAFASAILLLAASPAAADWNSIGQVRFGDDVDHDSVRGPDAPVRALRFTARHNPVMCDRVTAHFGDGDTADIFSGRLRQGEDVRVDLPGDRRMLRRVEFRCRAARSGATVDVAADVVERPRWDDDHRGWGGGSGGGVVRLDNWARWRQVATETFEGRRDRESSDPGWAGQHVEALALRPVDDDATCRRVVVQFGNGDSQELNVRRYDVLRHGRFYVLDLPGDARTVTRVGLACHAIADRDVRIEIWLKKKH